MNGNEFRSLIKLARLPLFTGTLVLYFLGVLLAVVTGYPFNVSRFIIAFFIVSTALLSMSYSNHYYDAKVDRYNTPTSFSGGSGGLLENERVRVLTKRFSILLLASSLILAICFIILFSFPVEFFLYVLAGNFLGWFYTAPPFKLAYHGLGELATMLAVGLMIPGLGYFVIAEQFDILFLLFIIPFMFYMGILILNAEIPDAKGDRQGNKKTIIVRKNISFGFQMTGLLAILATLYYFFLSLVNVLSSGIDLWLITLFSFIPLSFGILSLVKRSMNQIVTMQLVKYNITSIVLFALIVNSYFFFLILLS